MSPTTETSRAAQERARATAARLRLSFAERSWQGTSGAFAGRSAGSSIEYHDHRPYLLGDDPRDLDWRAYARTGQYTLKVHREEVAPRVDVALDLSASMFFDAQKAARAFELLHFCVEAAQRSGATTACHGVSAQEATPLPNEALLAGLALPDPTPDGSRAPDLRRVPWRARSMRVWISDLLFSDECEPVLAALHASDARGVILTPYCAAEADPDWSGSCELLDVESGRRTRHQLDAARVEAYRRAYLRHFDLWQQACRRRAITLARVSSDGSLEDALCAEALPTGVVELWT